MPALPLAPNIIRCSYTGTYAAAKWANVFHVRFTGPTPSQTDMNALATGLRNAWDTNLKAIVSGSGTLNTTTCVDLSSSSGLVSTNATASNGTLVNTTNLPASVALVASMKIARRYRGGHPRMYLVGQTGVNTVNATSWTGAWITTTSTAFAAWLTAVNALTFTSMPTITLVCLSYYAGGTLRATPFADPVSSIVVHSRVDTMRRRLGKELS